MELHWKMYVTIAALQIAHWGGFLFLALTSTITNSHSMQLKDTISKKGLIKEEKIIDLVCRIITARYNELNHALKTRHSVEQLSSSFLRDFDWKIQVRCF